MAVQTRGAGLCKRESRRTRQTGLMSDLRWMRIPGDTIFAFGMVVFAWFMLGLISGHSFADKGYVEEGGWEVTAERAAHGDG